MNSISWKDLRSFNGSQSEAFEELCCQLATCEIPEDARFIRKGKPDAGLECFAILANEDEWGWQAKFFEDMGSSQWTQLDDSVKTALAKHSKLIKYVICIPLDRADPRIEKQEWFMDKWDKRVAKWKTWASSLGMNVEFVYWGSFELLTLLSREKHRGRLYFWFGKESFSDSWFNDRLQEAIKTAGPRYTPEIDVHLPITELFDGLGRTENFLYRIKIRLRKLKSEYSSIHLQDLSDKIKAAAGTLDQHTQQLFASVLAVDKSIIDPIPWESISGEIVKALDCVQSCLDSLEPLKQTENASLQEYNIQRTGHEKETRQNANYHLRKFQNLLWEFNQFIDSDEVRLCNLPFMLLLGEAGKGKTHLLCDIAKCRIDLGLPTVLLMGQQFTNAEPWGQIIQLLHLNPKTTPEEFLGALEAVAQARGQKALLMIDALNEGDGKKIWASHLPAMLATISRFKWLSVTTSIRSSYEQAVITEELGNQHLVRIYHHGFADHEYQATRTFFDFYGLEHPSIPLLIPAFQTPLFLKILCEGVKESGATRIPTGLQGITFIFELFINTINRKLSGEAYLDYNPKRKVVWQAIGEITQTMAQERRDWLSIDAAEAITNQVLPTKGYEKSLLRHLVSEGILVETNRWDSESNWCDVIHFAYEKFSDHLIVKHLLDKYLDVEQPELAFIPQQPLSFIIVKSWANAGLIEALCIQIPERIDKEFVEIAPDIIDDQYACKGFVESIIWRKPQAISHSTKKYLNYYSQASHYAEVEILNAILTVAVNPDHPYNAKFLHSTLSSLEMADRDAWWSIFLHEQYLNHNAIDRLLDWAWSPENKDRIADDAIRLCGISLAWFFTTSNRYLRDRTTKAMVNLFTDRLGILTLVIEQFLEVDDPYVLERLYAVAYGCVLRSHSKESIRSLAQSVYDWIFRAGNPPVHILLRDYARGVVEYALWLGVTLDVIVDNIKPPYGSKWISYVPELDELEEYGKWWKDMPEAEWGRKAIYSSVMSYGDFARYVIGTNSGNSRWLRLRLNEPKWVSPEERYGNAIASLTNQQRKSWDLYLSVRETKETTLRLILQPILAEISDEHLSLLKDLQSDDQISPELWPIIVRLNSVEPEPLILEQEVTNAEQRFRHTLGKRKLLTFESDVFPYLDNPFPKETPPRFDLTIAQRWIVKRAFQLGWTVERFGNFDRSIDRYGDRQGRTAHKAERIGKKYQWLAYHEFLARLADNYQYREWYSGHSCQDQYIGSWQIGIRDIDPSCTLKKSGSGDTWSRPNRVWWHNVEYTNWESHTDDVSWMMDAKDLVSIEDLIEVSNPANKSNWLVLDGHFGWEQPTPPEEDRYNLTRRDYWISLHGYLVHQSNSDALFTWAVEHNFSGQLIPESRELYELFLGEYFWSSAQKYFDDPYERTVGWWQDGKEYGFPKPLMSLVDRYLQEDSGFDCSIDESIRIRLPNQHLVETMHLKWKGVEGCYVDPDGNLIAFDPSVQANGPSVLLINRKAFEKFLLEHQYSVLWIVRGEKQLIGGGSSPDTWKGRLGFSGAFRLCDSKLEGKITPKFRGPNSE